MNAYSKKNRSFGRRLVQFVVPLMLIASGGAAWAYFQATAPQMEKKRPQRAATSVDITTVKRTDAPSVITAMGTVMASRQVTLKARVSGDVQQLSPKFIPGARISKGDEILRLDPVDYEVKLKKAQSALETARADLAIEQGSQTIAREELRLLSETASDVVPTDLVLRKPQLLQAQAAVASAEADLSKARLDLERTVVTAPFNAMIINRSVNLGAHVNSQESLVTIVGTDEYWIEAVIPVERMKLLDFRRDGGCPAVIRSQAGSGTWRGRAVRTTGQVSETSRMATVIVAVTDPLGLQSENGSPPLILGDYVNVDIQGRSFEAVVELPRMALHDGNTVWIYDNGTLEIRSVALTWKQGDTIYIGDGLASGESVIVSDLPMPVEGMRLIGPGNKGVVRPNVAAERKEG
jgi:RND family efflux transporter MFP subunit